MNVREFLDDDAAVSPVIGVILMVAITVILAAVIGTFVLGLGDDLQNTQPTASFDFNFETAGNMDSVTISHAGGDSIDGTSDNVTVTTSGGANNLVDEPVEWNKDISAGSSKEVTIDGDTWSGETVAVNWQSADGSSSATLGSDTAPDL